MPLVEAMAADVPVLAYAAGAVPETLGGAGVLFAPKDLEFAAEMLGTLVYDRAVRGVGARGPAAAAADFAPDRIERRLQGGHRAVRGRAADDRRLRSSRATSLQRPTRFHVEDCIHRPALRHRDPRRVGVPLPADRRAPRAEAPGRGADDLRAGLHHLEERIPGGVGPGPRRHRPAVRQRAARATSTRSTATPSGSSTTRTRRDDEMEWLRQQGPWCPALLEYLERNQQQYDVLIFFTYLYAPTVLGVPHRAAQDHPGADGARRAGDPPRDLQGAVQPAGRHRLQHRRRAPVPDDALLDPRRRGGDGRLRRRPAAGAGLPARGIGVRRTAKPDPAPRTTPADDSSPTFRPHLAQRGIDLPPPASAARTDRALRRPHRSRARAARS